MNAAFLLGDLDFPSSFDNFAAMRSFFRCSSLGNDDGEEIAGNGGHGGGIILGEGAGN